MKYIKTKLIAGLALMSATFIVATPMLEAKSYGGRSSGGSRSYSSSKPKSYGSSSSSSKSKGYSSSKGSTKTKPAPMKFKDQKQKAAYEKAKANGTAFKSRGEATKSFQSKHAKDYPSKYTSKPATRPKHIPETTKGKDGNTYNVTYNQQQGGYGYTNSLGAFVMYNMMADQIMMNSMMQQRGYVVHPQHGTTTVVQSGWSSFWNVIGIIIAVICAGVVIVVVIKSFD